jgi:drug/metabolite transporter (DMT)-like permease
VTRAGALHTRTSRRSWAGIALAVAGSRTPLVEPSTLRDAIPAPLLGNLLVLGAVVSDALFTIFGKAASQRVSPLATSASVVSLALFLPLGLYQAASFDTSGPG